MEVEKIEGKKKTDILPTFFLPQLCVRRIERAEVSKCVLYPKMCMCTYAHLREGERKHNKPVSLIKGKVNIYTVRSVQYMMMVYGLAHAIAYACEKKFYYTLTHSLPFKHSSFFVFSPFSWEPPADSQKT